MVNDINPLRIVYDLNPIAYSHSCYIIKILYVNLNILGLTA